MTFAFQITLSDVLAFGFRLILFNVGLLFWFGYKVDFLGRLLFLEGDAGERAAIVIGRWLVVLGTATFLIPFAARIIDPNVWWPYLALVVWGGSRILFTARRHYRRRQRA
ncbi:MAG: hypothetical protein U1D96_09110 [Eubacteriales bacterium]|nr:hypothetical protein [Bacillota bacterium]MDP3050021.1 hypothetical protein [Eubacteriales bacterium]MDZ4043628.1 hypothetical protein [Eubacteriales bacterium]MDZ7610195.1 hypothetical protein [Eubacteriales bacterium]